MLSLDGNEKSRSHPENYGGYYNVLRRPRALCTWEESAFVTHLTETQSYTD
jgi:hypothetical protein